MNYINPNIAKVHTPKKVSLSQIPNYVLFENKNADTPNQLQAICIDIKGITGTPEEIKKTSTLSLTNKTAASSQSTVSAVIYGTTDPKEVSASTFFLHPTASITAQNAMHCLRQNSYISSNFDISILSNASSQIVIKTKKDNSTQSLWIDGDSQFVTFPDGNKITLESKDSIFGENNQARIELDVYTTEDDVFLGEETFPEDSLGTYVTTLSKAYFDQPLWFNLNTLIANRANYSNEIIKNPNPGIWHNAGTATAYRFLAKRFDGTSREPFFVSDALFAITGYNRNLEENDLTPYVCHINTAQNSIRYPPTLSHKTDLTHVEGQTQFFNFILSDAHHSQESDIELGIRYQFFTQSKKPVDKDKYEDMHFQNKSNMHIVNSIRLDVDAAMKQFAENNSEQKHEIGYVEISLVKRNMSDQAAENKIIAGNALLFQILPSHLYKVYDFAFLNSLGGWSSFNFGGDKQTDFKASTTTIFKTQTPATGISDQVEAMHSKQVQEVFEVETMPVNKPTVEWLKEMSTSLAVYELSSGRYVVVDDLQIKPNSRDELFKVKMKYRYSDSYNGTIK